MNSIETVLSFVRMHFYPERSTERAKITEENKRDVLRCAKRNNVTAFVYSGLQQISKSEKLTETEEAVLNELKPFFLNHVSLDIRQKHVAELLREKLTQADVPFAFIKGTLLKSDYPETVLRQMSDVDVCIAPENRPQIRRLMEELGMKEVDRDGNDPNFVYGENVRVETHGTLFYKRGEIGIEEYFDPELGKMTSGKISEEAFALNLIGHVIKHFVRDRTDMRSVLDLWVYRNRHPDQPNWDAVLSVLQKDGIGTIAENLIMLSEYWFGSGCGEFPPVIAELADHILFSSHAKSVAYTDVGLAGSRAKAIRSRLFLSAEAYEKRYPWVKGRRWLLPAAFLARLFSLFTDHRKTTVKYVKNLSAMKKSEADERKHVLERFGFGDTKYTADGGEDKQSEND